MKRIPLEWQDRVALSIRMSKLYDRMIRGKDDMANITFRVELLDIQKCTEEILDKYKDKYKGKY